MLCIKNVFICEDWNSNGGQHSKSAERRTLQSVMIALSLTAAWQDNSDQPELCVPFIEIWHRDTLGHSNTLIAATQAATQAQG